MHQQSTKQNELSTAMVDAYEAYRDNRITKEAFIEKILIFPQQKVELRLAVPEINR